MTFCAKEDYIQYIYKLQRTRELRTIELLNKGGSLFIKQAYPYKINGFTVQKYPNPGNWLFMQIINPGSISYQDPKDHSQPYRSHDTLKQNASRDFNKIMRRHK